MLRLSTTIRCAVAAAALLATTASLAQAGGLGGRLTDAGTKLDQDSQACRPINLGEYVSLLQEAAQNKRRAEKAAKAGVPIDQAQVDADLANASALFNRAQAALVQQCMRAAQGQGQPQAQPQTTPTPAATPTPAMTPAQGGVGAAGTNSALDVAENKLAEDIKACRPINVSEYDALVQKAHRNVMTALKAAYAGAPVDASKVNADLQRAEELLERARTAADAQKACPPKREATTEPPPKTTGALMPNSPPLSRFAQQVLAEHNELRARVGSPPLKWGPVQEQHATARAREMAQIGQLTHAPREGRGAERENISQAPPNYSAAQLVSRWGDEMRFLKPGLFPDVSTTGNWMDVAHATQMAWSETKEVGCGMAEGRGQNFLVCRYYPGGNKDGKPVVTQPQIAQAGGTTNASSGQRASLFDLGIYAGGAWATDWFTEPVPDIPSPQNSQIALNHEYGYDAALFVGYDLGAFRLEAETAYKKADMTWLDGFLTLPETFVDTKVEQPNVWSANAPRVATSDKQEPSNPNRCEAGSYWGAADLYKAAKAKGDAGGMAAAKAQMAAAIGHQYQAAEAATEAGEMANVSRYSLGDFLGKMMEGYKDLTGEYPPGYFDPPNGYELSDDVCKPVDTAVEQPKLPNNDTFKPKPPEKLEDPM